jgi:hypothetical protein
MLLASRAKSHHTYIAYILNHSSTAQLMLGMTIYVAYDNVEDQQIQDRRSMHQATSSSGDIHNEKRNRNDSLCRLRQSRRATVLKKHYATSSGDIHRGSPKLGS